jgi:hypothetical protein
MLTERNRQQMEAYILDHDTTLLDELAATDYLLVAAIGMIEEKANILKTAGNLAMKELTITDDEVRTFGDTTIIISTLHAKGTVMGHPFPSPVRVMSVFVGEELVARSMTPIHTPPG